MNVLCAASATTVRTVSTPAVSSSIPDGRRPVSARNAIAPYDQASAAHDRRPHAERHEQRVEDDGRDHAGDEEVDPDAAQDRPQPRVGDGRPCSTSTALGERRRLASTVRSSRAMRRSDTGRGRPSGRIVPTLGFWSGGGAVVRSLVRGSAARTDGSGYGLTAGRRSTARGRMTAMELTEVFEWEGRRVGVGPCGVGPAGGVLPRDAVLLLVCGSRSPRRWPTIHRLPVGPAGLRPVLEGPGHPVALRRAGAAFRALLDHWGLDRPHVVAHDIGGLVSPARAPGRGGGVRLALPGRRRRDPAERRRRSTGSSRRTRTLLAQLPAYIHEAIVRAYVGNATPPRARCRRARRARGALDRRPRASRRSTGRSPTSTRAFLEENERRLGRISTCRSGSSGAPRTPGSRSRPDAGSRGLVPGAVAHRGAGRRPPYAVRRPGRPRDRAARLARPDGMMAPWPIPRAGQPARPQDLVDLRAPGDGLLHPSPDPDDVDQQVAFGTSGHRGLVAQHGVQRDPHPRDHAGDLRLPQASRATTARCSSAATPTGSPSRRGRPRWRCWPPTT